MVVIKKVLRDTAVISAHIEESRPHGTGLSQQVAGTTAQANEMSYELLLRYTIPVEVCGALCSFLSSAKINRFQIIGVIMELAERGSDSPTRDMKKELLC